MSPAASTGLASWWPAGAACRGAEPGVFLLQGLHNSEELKALPQPHESLLQHIPNADVLHVGLSLHLVTPVVTLLHLWLPVDGSVHWA